MPDPQDTFIARPGASIELRSKHAKPMRRGVRVSKDTPSTALLQIFGIRANTEMYAMARMRHSDLLALRDACDALLPFLSNNKADT